MQQLASWIGRYEEATDNCALPLVRRIAALLNKDPDRLKIGDELPQGWQVCLFTSTARQSDLGSDGHPVEDKLMPPAPLPRRVLGGRRTSYLAPLKIGVDYIRRNEIVHVSEKHGKSGPLVLITTRASISRATDSRTVLIEEQDSIYLPEKQDETRTPDPASRPAVPVFVREMTFTPTMLFRYSAITFNTHRIHYDLPYATEQENYAGLMVNGGFTALLLLDIWNEVTGQTLASTAVRNRAAVICGGAFLLCGAPTEGGWTLWVEDARTSQIMLECKVR